MGSVSLPGKINTCLSLTVNEAITTSDIECNVQYFGMDLRHKLV